jgi:LuxR family maltose regulon positive regulatory protein
MSTPILATKLYIPPLRPKVVIRPRLIERLNEGLWQSGGFARKLTLISAPPGFGKTTLVSSWIYDLRFTIDDLQAEAASQEKIGNPKSKIVNQVAWLSLDEGDNDPTRFLAYLVAALQTIAANVGEGVMGLLQSPQPLPIERILTALLNEITTIPDNFVLVLDDYHLIEAQPIDEALTFLLDHLPPQMHLVITTREDPQLPRARYRARGQLTELRASDLRFIPSEAAGFLNQVMGLNLSAEDIAALESRTEGWIAGLQMAALSMQGREDTASFIQAFTGSHHFILDYLVEEVLQRQPERVRSFLLKTAILDRLSGPLCDAVRFGYTETPSSSKGTAVTDQEDGKVLLEALERGNLFVVPLDDKRQWYRYHHLFADVLQARAMEEQPNEVSGLHQRASEWYEQNDLPSDAVRHALAAEDFERAAGLVELAWPAMRRSRQEATVLGWVKVLPDELVQARPVLSVVYALALLDGGEWEAAEARLLDAERWLETATDMSVRPEAPAPERDVAEMVVVDKEQFRSLLASIANARAYRAQALGDVSGTVTYARRALDLLPEGDYYERGTTAALLGLAYWTSGDLEAAHRSFADGLATIQKTGGILIVIGGTLILAAIKTAQGRLHEAVSTYEQSLQLATEQGKPVLQGTAELYLGLSELHRERGDLEGARQHLLRGEALGEQASLPGFEYLWCVAKARIKEAQGDLDGALALLHEAERLYYRSPIPDVRPIAALKARVWVAQGRLAEALGWVRERGLSVDDDLSYLREFEHVTLARVLIAQYRNDQVDGSIHEAMGLLERLLQAAEAGERIGSVIEILVLQALAHEAQGVIPPALVPLERALTLAEPEGYVRIFVDEGTPMARLLLEAAARGIMPDYTGKLLAAFEAGEQRSKGKSRLPTSPSPQPLIEPLSQRELEVLRLLKTELSGPEIARELMIALSTVRTHTKSVYSKLSVNNRRAAVKRATELDLI